MRSSIISSARIRKDVNKNLFSTRNVERVEVID